jgi:Tfp pilus assembly protein PilF
MQALDYIDRALKLDPQNLDARLNRAKALFMLGYRRQGLLQAMELEKCDDEKIASAASALILAYK